VFEGLSMDRAETTTRTDDGARPKGRILRLKLGYNPNSSSIGTIVFAMPAALLGSVVAFGAVAGLLATAVLHRKGEGQVAGREENEVEDGDESEAGDEAEDEDEDRSS